MPTNVSVESGDKLRSWPRIILITGLLCITLAIGTTGFVLIEGYSWFEGFYMTLTTITTIGQR